MYKLLYTSNVPFDMSDWNDKQIKRVFAGLNCIMAVTEDGKTLQKMQNRDDMARTQYWTRIQQIGISKWAEGAAIGLVADGTCMIAEKPVRSACEVFHLNFKHINDTVKSWTDVVQVAASDAFFALCSDGTVRYVSFCDRYQAEYEEIQGWRDVIKIVPGNQNSIFGITKDGKILSAGYNAMNTKRYLPQYQNVVDVFPAGSECEDLYILTADGSAFHTRNDLNILNDGNPFQKLDGHFGYRVFAMTQSQRVFALSDGNMASVFPEQYKIISFAVGDIRYTEPFVIAVAEV